MSLIKGMNYIEVFFFFFGHFWVWVTLVFRLKGIQEAWVMGHLFLYLI